MTSHSAYIGLGANLGQAVTALQQALDALAARPDSRLVRRSSFYRSAPVGFTNQPDFHNAVALLATTLEPFALLAALQSIENAFGRERSFANAPRTLDLDLLLYDERRIAAPTLVVPHPRMHERAFVLAPLVEIAPEIVIPGRGRADALLEACAGQGIQRLDARSNRVR